MVLVGLRARREALTPCELVNSVMISPHPPRLRMKRRNTVSVTPAMGASTVAGAIFTGPIESCVGKEFMRRLSNFIIGLPSLIGLPPQGGASVLGERFAYRRRGRSLL